MGNRIVKKALPKTKTVGVVRSFGAKERAPKAYVACGRKCGTVSFSECASCEHARAIEYGPDGTPTRLSCDDAAPSGPFSTTEMLSLPRPRVGELMVRNVVCVRPELSLDAVTHLFLERGLHAAPVVDDEDRLLGTVAEADIQLEACVRADKAERVVADAMVPLALTIPESASVTLAAAIMAAEGAHYISVVSPESKVIGLLSATDVLYWLARADGYQLTPPRVVEPRDETTPERARTAS